MTCVEFRTNIGAVGCKARFGVSAAAFFVAWLAANLFKQEHHPNDTQTLTRRYPDEKKPALTFRFCVVMNPLGVHHRLI